MRRIVFFLAFVLCVILLVCDSTWLGCDLKSSLPFDSGTKLAMRSALPRIGLGTWDPASRKGIKEMVIKGVSAGFRLIGEGKNREKVKSVVAACLLACFLVGISSRLNFR